MTDEILPEGVQRRGDRSVISLEGGIWKVGNWLMAGLGLAAAGWCALTWTEPWWLIPLTLAALFTVDARWPSEVSLSPTGLSRWSPWPLQSFDVEWRELVGVQQQAWGLTLVRVRGLPLALPTLAIPRPTRAWLRTEIDRRLGTSGGLLPGVWSADRLEVPLGDARIRNATAFQGVSLALAMAFGVLAASWSGGVSWIGLGVVAAIALAVRSLVWRAWTAPDALSLNPHELAGLRSGSTVWRVPWAAIRTARLVDGVIQVQVDGRPLLAVTTHASVIDAEGARLVVRCINDLADRARAAPGAADGPDPAMVALLEGLRPR